MYLFWSYIYDSLLDKIFNFDRKKSINMLNLSSNEKILEIGVGTGLNLPHYPLNVQVTGIDFSSYMLKKAKQKKQGKHIILKIKDINNLNFNNNSYDKVLGTFVFRILSEPQKVLLELQKIIKKNGILVIVDTFKKSKNIQVVDYLTLPLGWGRNININELIEGTKWEVLDQKSFKKNSSTKIIKLINKK